MIQIEPYTNVFDFTERCLSELGKRFEESMNINREQKLSELVNKKDI